MPIVRLLAKLLAAGLLQLAIIWFVIAVVFLQVLATPEPIKQSLIEADVYQELVDEVSAQLAEQTDELIPGNEVAVRAAAENALTADMVQQQSEDAVDATYLWLRGETEQLDIALGFEDARVAFAENLGDALVQYLSDLPTCTVPIQLQASTEPWELSCLPPGSDVAQQRDEYVTMLLASDDFLAEATVSSDDAFEEGEFQPNDSNAPRYFQLLERSLLPALGMLVLASVVVVAIPRYKRRGIRGLGWHYLSSGAVLLLSAGLLLLVLDGLIVTTSQASALQLSLLDSLKQLGQRAVITVAIVGVGILTVGTALVVVFKKQPKK